MDFDWNIRAEDLVIRRTLNNLFNWYLQNLQIYLVCIYTGLMIIIMNSSFVYKFWFQFCGLMILKPHFYTTNPWKCFIECNWIKLETAQCSWTGRTNGKYLTRQKGPYYYTLVCMEKIEWPIESSTAKYFIYKNNNWMNFDKPKINIVSDGKEYFI